MAASKDLEDAIEDIDQDSELVPSRYSITSYGADYPVDGLVRRLESGDILIPQFGDDSGVPDDSKVVGFQRPFVWSHRQADRFIESLLLGLPVPGIFLFQDVDGIMLVLDGQQRLRSLQAYYKGVLRGVEFSLQEVHEQYKSLKYSDLRPEDRRHLDNAIIHATVVRQDEPDDDQSSIYLIFERLNTGGTALRPQEIRVALYRGQLVGLLVELNANPHWRTLVGKKRSRTLKDQELILRFIAFHCALSTYKRPMKDFLNRFMAKNRTLSRLDQDSIVRVFSETVSALSESLGEKAFRLRTTVNAALLDSLMVGLAERVKRRGTIQQASYKKLRAAYTSLLRNPEYISSIEKATADDESVATRMRLAIQAFAKI